MQLKRFTIWASLIVCLAAVLRLYRLDLYPPALNWDEVSHGYNAYSILKTGQDEWGRWFPSIFRAYGDYKLPVYIYLTVPFVGLMGLTEYSVRIVSALAGIGSVLFAILLANKLFKNNVVGLLAGLFLAIAPWSVFLSRIAVEANLSVLFIISGVYYFVLGVEQKAAAKGKAWGFVLSGVLLGLSLHTYNSARVFTPLLVGALALIYGKELGMPMLKRLKAAHIAARNGRDRALQSSGSNNQCSCHLVGLAIFLLCFSGVAFQFAMGTGSARFAWISVLDQGGINRINEARGTSPLPSPLPRLIHNKATFIVSESVKNYLSFFDPRFWFVTGGDQYQFNIPNYGLLYPLQIIPILLGLWWIWKKPNTAGLVILTWMLLAPIPASPTRDNPHTLRIVTMMPVWQILAAVGVYEIFMKMKKGNALISYGLMVVYGLVLIFSLRDFGAVYANQYRLELADSWQYGYKQIVQFIKQEYENYDQIIVTKKYGEPHEFILFYWPWDPIDYRAKKMWDYHTAWYWVNGFDKFVFVNDWEIQELKTQNLKFKTLLITSPGNVAEGWSKIYQVKGLRGKLVYEAYENN